MGTAVHHLHNRIQFLKDLEVVSNGEAEALPGVIYFLVSAMQNPAPGACCFVFPRKEEIGRLATVLFALNELRTLFPNLLSKHVSKLTVNDIVRIPPEHKTFCFLGDDPQNFGRVILRCRPAGNSLFAQRSVPKAFADRLQKVTTTQITGKLEHCWLKNSPSRLDILTGIQSHGNLSMIPNLVAVLDTQGHFKEFISHTKLKLRTSNEAQPIQELRISDDMSNMAGQNAVEQSRTLIEVTSSADLLVENFNQHHQKRPVTVVNEISLLSNPQHFDSISEMSRLIIIAEHSEWEKIHELRQRGCKVWSLSKNEIQCESSTFRGFFKDLFQASANSNATPDAVICKNPFLEKISDELGKLNASPQIDTNEALKGFLCKLFGLLMAASNVLRKLKSSEIDEFQGKLATLRSEFVLKKAWLSDDEFARLNHICVIFGEAILPKSQLGTTKSSALHEVFSKLKNCGKKSVGVMMKREQNFEVIQEIARNVDLSPICFTGQSSSIPNEFFDSVVCVSWPGAEIYKRFFRKYMTGDIRVIAYPFELQWLNQCRRRIASETPKDSPSQEERGHLLDLNATDSIKWPDGDTAPPLVDKVENDDLSLLSFERILGGFRRGVGITNSDSSLIVDAVYVEFAGGAFAYMTEGHTLPIATHLLSKESSEQRRLPEEEVADWKIGDYVVFLKSGETEVLRNVADKIMGVKAISLRNTAYIWKEAIAETGFSTLDLQRKLAEKGCKRTLATIRNWVYKDAQIGPDEKSDLEFIAAVSNSTNLASHIDDVWSAISQIKAYHISAGSVLRRILAAKLPAFVFEIDRDGAEIEIEEQGKFLGSAKILKVESIASKAEKCSPSLVNHLRYEQEILVI